MLYQPNTRVYALWDVVDPREGLLARGNQLGRIAAILPSPVEANPAPTKYRVNWDDGHTSDMYDHEIAAKQKLNR